MISLELALLPRKGLIQSLQILITFSLAHLLKNACVKFSMRRLRQLRRQNLRKCDLNKKLCRLFLICSRQRLLQAAHNLLIQFPSYRPILLLIIVYIVMIRIDGGRLLTNFWLFTDFRGDSGSLAFQLL